MALALDVRTRRIAFVALLVVAALAFVTALVATLRAAPDAGTWLLVSVVVLVLALAGELFLLLYGASRPFDEGDAEWYNWEKEAREAGDLLLRCSSCRQTFTLRDTGERPLRHACPHCGRKGILRDAPKARGA